MNNNNGASFAARAVISSLLLVAVIVGIVYLGNYFSNRSDSTDAMYSDVDDTQIVTLDKPASKYDFDISAGKVTFVTTDETPYIVVKDADNLKVYADHSNDSYKVNFKYKNNGFFDFLDGLFYNGGYSPEIEVYLPENEIDKLKIDVSAGVVDVSEIAAKALDVEVSAGKLEVKNCTIQDFESNVSAGKFDFYADKDIKTIDSSISAGKMNLYLPDDIDGFKIKYSISAGSIDNDSSFDVSGLDRGGFARGGNVEYGDNSCNIKLGVSAGSISINDF